MKLLLTILLLGGFSGQILAQGTIFDVDPAKPFHHGSLTFSHPILDREDYISTFTGTYNLSLNLRVSESNIVHLGIPYNYLGFEDRDDSESGTGNIKIGFQSINDTTEGNFAAIQFFIYLPSADEQAVAVQLFNDYTDFFNQLPDIYSLMLHYAVNSNFSNDFAINYFIGGNIIIPESDSILNDPEIFFRFAIEPIVKIDNFNIFFTFKTIAIISEDVDDFSDRFVSMFGFGASIDLEKYRPKISYKVYLDEPAKDLIDGVFSLGVDFNLGE